MKSDSLQNSTLNFQRYTIQASLGIQGIFSHQQKLPAKGNAWGCKRILASRIWTPPIKYQKYNFEFSSRQISELL